MMSETSDPAGELKMIQNSVRELLRWEKESGTKALLPMQETHVVATSSSTALSFAPQSDQVRQTPAKVDLEQLKIEVSSCTRCPLHKQRTQTVFARGNPQADLVFVGEGPGYYEDQQGVPFVGKAGQLLDRMISAMGYQRDDVYICNVVKCRPPENRTPLPNEAEACKPFLKAQLDTVNPKAIVALGKCAAENLGLIYPDERPWRGVWKSWNQIPAMCTYHPAFLLRSPQFKKSVWQDLQEVMKRLGKKL